MIPRYSRAAMNALWTEQAKLERWLEVELAVCRAWAAKGVIPAEDLAADRGEGRRSRWSAPRSWSGPPTTTWWRS